MCLVALREALTPFKGVSLIDSDFKCERLLVGWLVQGIYKGISARLFILLRHQSSNDSDRVHRPTRPRQSTVLTMDVLWDDSRIASLHLSVCSCLEVVELQTSGYGACVLNGSQLCRTVLANTALGSETLREGWLRGNDVQSKKVYARTWAFCITE